MSKAKYQTTRRPSKKARSSPLSNPLVWIVGGIILLAGAFFAVWRANQPAKTSAPPVGVEVSGQPSLKVDQDKVDLGDVPLNETVTVTFQLANTGDQPLRFTKAPYIEVKEGC